MAVTLATSCFLNSAVYEAGDLLCVSRPGGLGPRQSAPSTSLGADGISLLIGVVVHSHHPYCDYCFGQRSTRTDIVYYAMILLLETAVLGVFVVDRSCFIFFWDLVLIPMYFIIGIFVCANPSYAAIKFFLYTLLGSVFRLVGFIGRSCRRPSYRSLHFRTHEADAGARFAVGCSAVDLLGYVSGVCRQSSNAFPLHTWLPDAHVESADRRLGFAGQLAVEATGTYAASSCSAAR